MTRRFRRLIAGVWAAGLLATWPIGAQDAPSTSNPMPSPSPVGAMPPAPEPVPQWLDEVRAQRQAREERRRAAKEAMGARRRWLDPWGAAQQEAWEQETQRRRDAFMEKVERDRKAFRSHSPWGPPHNPWRDEAPALGPGPEFRSPSSPDTAEAAGQAVTPAEPYPPLHGWDNRWYYRGY